MKIVENGKSYGYPKRCRCESCQSLIEVEYDYVYTRPYQRWNEFTLEWEDELYSEKYEYFFCPVCGSEVDATKGFSANREE